MNWFISYYQPCFYSIDWYGVFDYAPSATIVLYDDTNCFCIGYMDTDLPSGVKSISEDDADKIILNANLEDDDVWYGDKLISRWAR